MCSFNDRISCKMSQCVQVDVCTKVTTRVHGGVEASSNCGLPGPHRAMWVHRGKATS